MVQAVTAEETRMTSKVVLVVEDDPDIRKMIVYALKPFGCHVETAADGAQAVTLLDDLRPDLMILDLNLPYVAGEEVLEHARSSEWHDDMRVIVVTVFGEDHTRSLVGSVEHIFQKPYNLTDFRAAVEQTLSRS
jgi:DNA-binding response OmpR family regulator